MKFNIRKNSLAALAIAGTISLNSCVSPTGGTSSDNLQKDLSRTLSTYQVLNLQTGAIEGRSEIPDLTTNNAYREQSMVFKLIPSGETLIGTNTGSLGSGVDPSGSMVTAPQFYMGVFEITQAQWQLIAGTTPWTAVASYPVNSLGSLTTAPTRPAFGLSEDIISTALNSFNTDKKVALSLPNNTYWERACRAGSNHPFAWGASATNTDLVAQYAVVAETVINAGARPVGERTPNDFGLYDMHGNVWEITHTGLTTHIRGGSWRDSLSLSRAGHVMAIDRGTAHGLVGARLVIAP
jgi:formylglycine-generating enzyme required for sulfatase activity